MSTTCSSSMKRKRKNAPGNRTDPGWEHGIEIDKASKKVQCKYCNSVRHGGVYRIKHHLAGTGSNVEACPQVPEDVKLKMREIVQGLEKKSSQKRHKLNDIGEEEYGYEYDDIQNRRGSAMDNFVNRSKGGLQTTINQKYKKEEREDVCQQIARFLYTSGIAFNVVNNPEFTIMVKMIGDYWKGLKPPSYHEIRVKFLNNEVNNVMAMLEEFKEEWKKTGCTIMSDGWSDRKRRSICNFLINSPKGSVFLSSVDTSDISKTADKVLEMLDAVIETVGEENVVQLITDNAANYKAAGERLMVKREKLFWTPCAAHCIDLMLEDLDKKIDVHKATIAMARKVTTFIYSRTMLHTWMKEFTKDKELIRPGVTRFATSYLTLRSLNEYKGSLLALFSSNKWKSSKFAKSNEGRKIQKIVLDTRGFWPNVVTCLRGALPLVKVLRLVDSDENPAMGFIYAAMKQARKEITENFNNVERHYKPILAIIDDRWANQLNQPLHAAAYFLNPQFQYSPDFQAGAEVKIADWWDSYGDECPELKRFAIRILSLTCSSSGCERNWSSFEMVHTNKRNRLHQQKMNDLVFVMYNLKLKRRQEKRASKSVIHQPIVLDDLSSDDEWIAEIEEPVLPADGAWLNDFDRAARRFARAANNNEVHDGEDFHGIENEIHVLSDDDFEAAVGSMTLVRTNTKMMMIKWR